MKLGPVHVVRWSQRFEGDFSRGKQFETTPRSWLTQVHGGEVVVETEPLEHRGTEADAIVSTNPQSILSIATADCVPIALVGDNGVFAAVHAGWRGIVAGVIENTAAKMRELGANDIIAAAGPCIGVECYEFNIDTGLGPEVVGKTSWGTPGFELRSAVRSKCKTANIDLQFQSDDCTSCMTDDYFSARAREETERMAMLVCLN